ncbi:signal peptide peptidase SppA [Paracnuella aquatica]|uniref:signal peptide peptidase SppA n=1 Tax=Paracnuella aquatica TaxID=2268757 RepID=UPI000DEEFABD|nr:signal peptide peptidase SppA [Paracnuella aquatica]RPD51292.1 signal peptide peptidase SppA [Paracnuella aquatica]
MTQFFKIFFASLLALIVFGFLTVFILFGVAGSLASKAKPEVAEKSVLVLDLGEAFPEQKQPGDPITTLASDKPSLPGLYDVVRLLESARNDKKISGVYIKADGNANSFASSNELRQALLQFKTSGKPIIAYGDVMSQGAYFVASTANQIFLNPVGQMDWSGYNVDLVFFKNMLDRLEIQPQIFYAGKFKSATEPFRTTQMTPENREQTVEWLGDLYQFFLNATAKDRKIDTAKLHQLAQTAAIQKPEDAVATGLIDGLKYDDEIKSLWKSNLKLGENDKINFLSINTYAEAADYKRSGKDRIAVVFASGNIVDGDGSDGDIGGDKFQGLLRRLRMDRSVKAIVLRVNSGGGSALASEKIWRELSLTKGRKPVVVSFGDVAASGGYYIGCGADSIFAHPNTITGSIGVFTLVPNMEGFFKSKLGVTFDGVKTANHAGGGSVVRPLTEMEQKMFQSSVDRIYAQFKDRVAKGRKKDLAYIDSIAQGRVWSGADALRLGLVDRMGNLQDAIDCAARLAKTTNYRLREYPEQENWLNQLLKKETGTEPVARIREQIGAENFSVLQQMISIRQMCDVPQTRLPFTFVTR